MIEVACLSHSKGGEDTNTQYIILGDKVVLVDADLGIVLEEFDYPV